MQWPCWHKQAEGAGQLIAQPSGGGTGSVLFEHTLQQPLGRQPQSLLLLHAAPPPEPALPPLPPPPPNWFELEPQAVAIKQAAAAT